MPPLWRCDDLPVIPQTTPEPLPHFRGMDAPVEISCCLTRTGIECRMAPSTWAIVRAVVLTAHPRPAAQHAQYPLQDQTAIGADSARSSVRRTSPHTTPRQCRSCQRDRMRSPRSDRRERAPGIRLPRVLLVKRALPPVRDWMPARAQHALPDIRRLVYATAWRVLPLRLGREALTNPLSVGLRNEPPDELPSIRQVR